MSIYTPIAYPLSFSDNPQRERLENSNQVLLPPEILQNEEIEFPVYFTVSNNEKSLNVAVFEFTETPNVIYMPWFILNLLDLKEGEQVDVKMIEEEIPSATEITLMHHEHEFVTLTDPKAILEHHLSKNYTVLTKGETISIKYMDDTYYIDVVECEPADTIHITNSDINLDFDEPIDYVEPPKEPTPPPSAENIVIPRSSFIHRDMKPMTDKFVPFSGSGHRLGNK